MDGHGRARPGPEAAAALLGCGSGVIPADLIAGAALQAAANEQRKLACGHLPSGCADTCARRARPRAAERRRGDIRRRACRGAGAATRCAGVLDRAREAEPCCSATSTVATRSAATGGLLGCHSPASFYLLSAAPACSLRGGDVVRRGASRGMNNCTCVFSSRTTAVAAAAAAVVEPVAHRELRRAAAREGDARRIVGGARLRRPAADARGARATGSCSTRCRAGSRSARRRTQGPGQGHQVPPVGRVGRRAAAASSTRSPRARTTRSASPCWAGSRGGGLEWFGRLRRA